MRGRRTHFRKRRVNSKSVTKDDECAIHRRAEVVGHLADELLQRIGVQRGRACAHRIECRLIHFTLSCMGYTNWLVCY